jgi:hypothetical protein
MQISIHVQDVCIGYSLKSIEFIGNKKAYAKKEYLSADCTDYADEPLKICVIGEICDSFSYFR